jgi:predicted secreted protein
VAPGNLNVSRSSIVSLLQQYLGVIAAAFFGALGIELFSMNNRVAEVPASTPMIETMADEAGGMEIERLAANKAADTAYTQGGGLMDSITSFITGLADHIATWFFLGCMFAVLLIVLKKRYYDNCDAKKKSTFKKVFTLILVLCLFVGAYSALTPREEYYYEDLYYLPADNDPAYSELHIFSEPASGLVMPVNVWDDVLIELNDDPDDKYRWVLTNSSDMFLLEEQYVVADEKYRWTFEVDSPGTKYIQMDYVDTRQNSTAESFNLTLDAFDV